MAKKIFTDESLSTLIDETKSYVDNVQNNLDAHINDVDNPHGTQLSHLGVTATATELNYMNGVTSAVQNQLNSKLGKTTYEYNTELALGSTGKVCIGKFPMYDSNISVEIKSTTNTTYNGTLIIATQNINTTAGGSYTATVYGDASNSLTGAIKIHYGSGSNVFSVYIDLPSWSKNLLHIQCVSLAGTPTDIATTVTEIPSNATIVPTNALKVQLDNKANSSHTHNYAGSSSVGGAATSANKINTDAGSATQPVYFANGIPVATTYTLGKSVPSDAKFTDTVYTHPTTSGNKHIPSGGSSGQILRWASDGTATWGNDNNTTYTLSSFGITATATELNYCDGVTSNIQTQLNAKAASSHTHDYLPLSGGQYMTGQIGFKNTYSGISGDNNYLALNTAKDFSNTRVLQFLSQNYKSDVKQSIRIQETISGSTTSYYIYGQHNVTCGTSDLTAGSSSLTTGFIYQVYS